MLLSSHILRKILRAAPFLLLFAPSLSLAGNLQWQALPDRERVTIRMEVSEGLPGQVGRIAPTGLLIPFTQVPGGLHVENPPEGARIFQGTRHQGRSLVLLTQTPEFGYMVARQTERELVVDFYHNPLGARWKPSGPAATTEIPPTDGVPQPSEPDAVNTALAQNPQGGGQVPPQQPAPPAQLMPPPGVPVQAVPAAPQTPPPAQPAPTPQSQTSPAQERPGPTVVELTGSPEQAMAGTRLAEPPMASQQAPSSNTLPYSPAAPGLVAAASPQATPPQATPPQATPPQEEYTAEEAQMQPFLDTRRETSNRSAPLPLPEPPMSSVGGLGTPAVSGTVDFSAQPPAPTLVLPDDEPALSRQTAAPQEQMPAYQAVPAQPAQAQPVQAIPAQSAPGQTTAAAQAQPGVGTRTHGPVYGGLINTGSLDDVPDQILSQPYTPPAQAYSQEQAAIPAQPYVQAQPGTSDLPAYPQAQDIPPIVQPAVPAYTAETPVASMPAPGQEIPQRTVPDALTPSVADPNVPETPQVIYTDAEGNPVPPPPDAEVLIPEIQADLTSKNFAGALEKSELLLNRANLTPEQREELLHIRAEMLFALNRDNLAPKYNEISDATNQAINYNQKSWRNAGALLRLGYMNLRLGNIPEAEARFNILRRLHPNDENVPLTYYYWGDYHFNRGELQKAADEFQYILEQYSNSRYAREAALGLARSFYRLGYYDQSYNVVDYIEKRWERFYTEYPPFLNMMGDVAFRLNKLDYALNHYWLYVNLEPQGQETDIILTRIGDIYSMQREKAAARELYNESLQRFPDRDGSLVAMMRLAEDRINDDPTIAGMFSMFDGPFNLAPVDAYRTIISRYPDSALAPLAEIKLGMWHLWKHEFAQTLDLMNAFLDKYPEHDLAPKAREIALQTFAIMATEAVADGRYDFMRRIWEQYPIVREQEALLPMESRIALAVSYRHEGRPDEALKIVEPFFLGSKVPEYSEMALSLVLSVYLEYDQWNSIREVARRVDLWELSPEAQQQLDFALALSAENLGKNEEARPLWEKLYEQNTLPPAHQAYTAFFLARDAERERELEKAYTLGKEALRGLLEQVERSPNAQDVGKIQNQLASLMDVCENAGRMREALGFAEQYLDYLPADNPERNAVRYRIARIHRKQGDIHTWRTILTDISQKAPNSVYGRLAASELSAASIAEEAARYSPTGRL